MAYVDSPWVYQTVHIEDPPAGESSDWVYAYVTLAPPSGASDSAWSYQTITIAPPHQPIAFWDGTKLVFAVEMTWDGSALV